MASQGEITDDMLKAVTGVLNKYGKSFTDELKAKVAKKTASGNLLQSIKFDVTLGNEIISLSISAADYLKYVDSGRGAGKQQPPMQDILQWIQAKHVQPYDKKDSGEPDFKLPQKHNRRGQFGKGPLLERQTSLAWAIARSIQKNGIKPFPVTPDPSTSSGLAQDVQNVLFISLTKIVSNELFESCRTAGIKMT